MYMYALTFFGVYIYTYLNMSLHVEVEDRCSVHLRVNTDLYICVSVLVCLTL